MLLTISTDHRPATDLGFLLHKNPDRAQSFEVSTGTAHVFYPEASEQRCTAALLLEVDPAALARGRRGSGGAGFALGQYVHDRSYVASSLLAVALAKVFTSARRGVCAARPDLVDVELPLVITVPALSCRDGAAGAQRFFGPLGWDVDAMEVPFDPDVPAWGPSRCVSLTLRATLRLADAINHLYVALPVLDDAKHYWVEPGEVDKLLRAGTGWLAEHPDREWIARSYLAHQRSFTDSALARLAELDPQGEAYDAEPHDSTSPVAETNPVAETSPVVVPGPAGASQPRPSLSAERQRTVLALVRELGAHRVLDLGMGSGALLPGLLADPEIAHVTGVDVSHRAVRSAARRVHLEDLPERQQARLTLRQGALTYTDPGLAGHDVAVLMEVVEHLDPDRLPALEQVVFGAARPGAVLVTTPNAEFNPRYPGLAPGALRHPDHRFEWTRAEFTDWAQRVAADHGYGVTVSGIGPADPELGSSTQLAVFRSAADAGAQPATAQPAAAWP